MSDIHPRQRSYHAWPHRDGLPGGPGLVCIGDLCIVCALRPLARRLASVDASTRTMLLDMALMEEDTCENTH